jgi:hypothetical protein
MKEERLGSALRVSLIYALLGVAWILLTDLILVPISNDQTELTALQTLKGFLYSAVPSSFSSCCEKN